MVPLFIAEGVCQQVSCFLGVDLPERYPVWLAARADVCFRRDGGFRKSMRRRGNGGRDTLVMYMRHWLSALLNTERPDLGRALPFEHDLGRPLPPGTHPLINRRKRLPLPPPMTWNPDRVLNDRHWHFLRELAAPAPRPKRPTVQYAISKQPRRPEPEPHAAPPGLLHSITHDYPIC